MKNIGKLIGGISGAMIGAMAPVVTTHDLEDRLRLTGKSDEEVKRELRKTRLKHAAIGSITGLALGTGAGHLYDKNNLSRKPLPMLPPPRDRHATSSVTIKKGPKGNVTGFDVSDRWDDGTSITETVIRNESRGKRPRIVRRGPIKVYDTEKPPKFVTPSELARREKLKSSRETRDSINRFMDKFEDAVKNPESSSQVDKFNSRFKSRPNRVRVMKATKKVIPNVKNNPDYQFDPTQLFGGNVKVK